MSPSITVSAAPRQNLLSPQDVARQGILQLLR